MTTQVSLVADGVIRYAERLHAAVGVRHHVASPLGAWLLLALAAPASRDADRETLTEVLGCDVGDAAAAAASLLADPHPLVAAASAVWTARGFGGGEDFRRWLHSLPTAVTTGELPGQPGVDAWARDHTFGLIERFPLDVSEADLVLATALATKVSWLQPFQLAPAASLGNGSPWASRLDRVLRTPAGPAAHGHLQFIAATPDAGDVIVHAATAAGGLIVLSAGAQPDVPAGRVLAAAHRVGRQLALGTRVEQRDLADLPLGEGPLWVIREVLASADSCSAILPAWSASSRHDLSDPVFGFAAARRALAPGSGRWDAGQAAMARYTRTGFEAAAVTGFAVAVAARVPGRHREAELRFGHPYAVVALVQDPAHAWHGLPIFSAWVGEPAAAGDDAEQPGKPL